jgi:pimeloyl-ACP methyl ester carboxylesterase
MSSQCLLVILCFFGLFWCRYWKDPTPENAKPILALFTFDITRYQYVTGAKDVEKISPDNWYLDYYFLALPGHDQIQLDLFYDYRTNLKLYPAFQATFRKWQFPTLIVWGKNDFIFTVAGAKAFLTDLPHAELHILDGGHFVLEDHLVPIANYILKFAKKVTGY